MGRAPGGSVRGSRGSSRGSRGRGRGGQRRTVSDGHVDTESETYCSYEDSTYQPETEPVETPYEGDDNDEMGTNSLDLPSGFRLELNNCYFILSITKKIISIHMLDIKRF
ncbi:unnamed protein product, partial [Cuscuta epithymum]